MRKMRILVVGFLIAAPVFLLLAQDTLVETFERNFRPHVSQRGFMGGVGARAPQARIFYINGLEYRAWISGQSLAASPDWTSTQPMPLGFARLEEISRQELAKIVTNNLDWSVTSFQLHSIPENQALKWYFAVEMKPFWEPGPAGAETQHDSFCVFVDLSGKPGLVTPQFARSK